MLEKKIDVSEIFYITVKAEDLSLLFDKLLEAGEIFPEYTNYKESRHDTTKAFESKMFYGYGEFQATRILVKI